MITIYQLFTSRKAQLELKSSKNELFFKKIHFLLSDHVQKIIHYFKKGISGDAKITFLDSLISWLQLIERSKRSLMELFVQQPKRDQKFQNFCWPSSFLFILLELIFSNFYVANPHGIEVKHWSANPKVPRSSLVRSTFFFYLVTNLTTRFRPLFGLFVLGYGQNAKIYTDQHIRGHFELIQPYK